MTDYKHLADALLTRKSKHSRKFAITATNWLQPTQQTLLLFNNKLYFLLKYARIFLKFWIHFPFKYIYMVYFEKSARKYKHNETKIHSKLTLEPLDLVYLVRNTNRLGDRRFWIQIQDYWHVSYWFLLCDGEQTKKHFLALTKR